jgi:hypothetical protein
MRHPHALFLHPHTGRKGDDGTHNFHVWTWISRVGSEGTRHTTSMCVRESHAYVRRGRGTQLLCVYVNLTRRFGGDEDKKRKRNYAERTKLQRAVIYIVPITNQCLSKCGTFIYSPWRNERWCRSKLLSQLHDTNFSSDTNKLWF